MCTLIKKCHQSSVVVYKVAVKDENGKYYSPATGCEYIEKQDVTPIRGKCNRLSELFNENITDINRKSFKSNMYGRTSGFTRKKDAIDFLKILKKCPVEEKHSIVLIKIKISKDLMSGFFYYTEPYEVIAGKYINSIKELKNT